MSKSKTLLNEDGLFIASHCSYGSEVGTVFAELVPSRETVDKLQLFCDLNGISQKLSYSGEPSRAPFDYHCTVLYSKDNPTSPVASLDLKLERDQAIKMRIAGFELFGEKKNVPVFVLNKNEAYTQNLHLLHDTLHTHFSIPASKFPFTPHVSLSYDPGDYSNVDLSYIERLMKTELVFDRFRIVRKSL